VSTPEQDIGGAGTPSEEELRAAYEAELARVSTTDMIAQALVSLLNLGARRLPSSAAAAAAQGGAGSTTTAAGGDLEQVRDAVDAARALLEILERRMPQELAPLRDALSQLQMAYAREVGAAPAARERPAAQGAAHTQQQGAGGVGGERPPQAGEGAGAGEGEGPSKRPGPAESSGRLWVPGR